MTKNIFQNGNKKKNLEKKKISPKNFFSEKNSRFFSKFSTFQILRFFQNFENFQLFSDFEILRFFFTFSKFRGFFFEIFFKKLFDFQNFHFFSDFSIFHYFTIFNTNSLKITENTQKIELNRFRVLRTPLDNYLRSYERLKTTHIPNSIPRSHPQGLLLLIVCVRVLDVRCHKNVPQIISKFQNRLIISQMVFKSERTTGVTTRK